MHIELSKDKLYFGIGEIAEAFGVNASLIRFWDKELIYHLVKERGFTLEGAKTHLKEGQKKTLDTFEIISKLESVKAQLNSIKNSL